MNEKWKVLTYREYDFVDEKGRQQKGRTLHCYRKNNDNRWPGVEYSKLNCKFGTDAYNVVPVPGKEYEVVFNRFGKVANLVPVQ